MRRLTAEDAAYVVLGGGVPACGDPSLRGGTNAYEHAG